MSMLFTLHFLLDYTKLKAIIYVDIILSRLTIKVYLGLRFYVRYTYSCGSSFLNSSAKLLQTYLPIHSGVSMKLL